MKRRNFLLLTIAGGIAAITPFCKSRRPSTTLTQPFFLSAMCDVQTLRKIGTQYRTATPAEASEDALVQLLTTGGGTTGQLDNKIKDDFTSGRTVTIDGWVLAVTEARQCALFSFQKP
ncbi:MAG TPA: hypothetical protein VFE32_02390 [Puia sp.]|jgi:hypothetical protein|nr:hypothetical protein [Puia sp.]